MDERERNDLQSTISQALQIIKEKAGDKFDIEKVNLAELQRLTGLSRKKLRNLKGNGFIVKPHGLTGRKKDVTVLSGFTGMVDALLMKGVTNSSTIKDRLDEAGYTGSQTTIKEYISQHKDLVPAKRQIVAPQGNRGRRYTSDPGESFQMDWGFVNVEQESGATYRASCFAMICHHCGERYVEFFPNAKQENLFIGMIHAFQHMGIPRYVLTDNMKSVVIRRDLEGHPIWQKDYETFMKTIGFQTKLCKPRHPFTKGKVERLIQFVKGNFLADRVFFNITDLNQAALEWCNNQNVCYHRATDCIPQQLHLTDCLQNLSALEDSDTIRMYLCPARMISFDGFVNYEGRRFGVPYSYHGSQARVMRYGTTIYIYSLDLQQLLTTHEVTWSKRDRFCRNQYVSYDQPEEFPTMPIQTSIRMLEEPKQNLSFEKFNFDREVDWNE